MNHIQAQCNGFIKNDGAGIQITGTDAQIGVLLSHNWVHDFPKKGLRFDGDGDPMTYNGTMEFNVVWNIEGNREMYPKRRHQILTSVLLPS